ncbi:hypothetical protein M422DRAFT_271367 [Sphaerobolus stellatus SS14]|uniref:Unplaced genomic scaffold SPHSTscaffold_260, whole genome shotgun sequence n=1 Tax=Sphaerobolus stellatus (strain SS14) TaxID=990650 RepID=A0A0C9UEN2_SPHS4|nr:hypothetical protein M422DRAFT_271367 [Sphaerobolus stellatus SS14]
MGENTPLLHNPKVCSVFILSKENYCRNSGLFWHRDSLFKAFAASSFGPCVPEVAKDLNTTGEVINFTAVGLYMFMLGISTFIWAPYSRFYGRRPICLISLPPMCLGSLIVSLSTSVVQLTIGRALQASAASCFNNVGVSSISDIYKLEERGTAIGAYYAAVLLSLAIAPMTGGIAAIYASWRLMPIIIFGISLSSLISVIMFPPETCHPGSRGVDKLREGAELAGQTYRPKWVWLNPFQSLKLLRGPNVSFVAIATACAFVTDCVMLISLSYTIGPRNGLTSPALIRACFLPSGLGSTLGSPIVGRISDKIIISKRKQRGGKRLPEDHLLATLPGAMFLVPLSDLMYGIAIQFIPGK